MKYIRTKDGIFDTEYEPKAFKWGWHTKFIIDDNNLIIYDPTHKERIANHGQILGQADIIEELIMPGDLVRYDVLYMSWIEKDRGDKVRGFDMHLIPRKSVDMLWIPVGNDTECYPNFKLVASKENEEGELELL